MADGFEPREQLVVEVLVREIERCKAFYVAVGFEVFEDRGEFVDLVWEGNHLFLDARPDLPEAATGGPRANVRIMVGDVDAYWARAQALGARISSPIANRDYGLRDFTIVDPDGFGLRFASRQ